MPSLFTRFNHPSPQPHAPCTRRDALRLALAASASLLLSGCVTCPDLPAGIKPNGRRVAVVGAGLAGLACAYELTSAGYDVLLLEASNRIGGRVWTLTDLAPGRIVEAGGEWIGPHHPIWAAYASKFGLELLEVSEDPAALRPLRVGPKRLDEEDTRALWRDMEAALARLSSDATQVDAASPWNTPAAATLDSQTAAAWLDSLNLPPLARAGLAAQLVGITGVPLERQSYLAHLVQIKAGGLDRYSIGLKGLRCRGGNAQLPAKFHQALTTRRVLLQTPITSIVTGSHTVILTTAAGRKLFADDVVLAIPPGAWTRIHFAPALPADLCPQMGPAVKYLAVVKNRFWRQTRTTACGCADGPVNLTWDATAAQPGDDNAILAALSAGPAATDCLAADHLDLFIQTAIQRIHPRFARSFLNARFIAWPRDPWIATGFSFPAPGQILSIGPRLLEGLGRLHFAGEHVCTPFAGTMEGALQSGAAAARRLAQRDGIPIRS